MVGVDAGPGALVAGRYRLEVPLGEGGFGAVFRAVDLSTRERVAVKVLVRGVVDMGPRFRREAELAMRLSHPNTVRTLDAGDDPRLGPYIVLELLEGQSLDALLRTQGALAPPRVAAIALAILGSLEEAHARGIVHRDIKPANVFLVRAPVAGVKVLDFGIAKSTNADTRAGLTREGQTLGTPAYMAPEQVTGGALGPETDLYALGLLIAEALGGRAIYEGREPLAVLVEKLDGKPVPIPEAVRGTPLGPVVDRALAHAREARFPSAAAMRAAIHDAVAAMPDETFQPAALHAATHAAGATGWGVESSAGPGPGAWSSSAASQDLALGPTAIGDALAAAATAATVDRRGSAPGPAAIVVTPPLTAPAPPPPALGPPLPRSAGASGGLLRGCLLGLGIVATFTVLAAVAGVLLFGLEIPGSRPRRARVAAPVTAAAPVPQAPVAPAPSPVRSVRQVACPRLGRIPLESLNERIRGAGWTVAEQSVVHDVATTYTFGLARGDAHVGQLIVREGPDPHAELAALRPHAEFDATWAIAGQRLLFLSLASDAPTLLAALC